MSNQRLEAAERVCDWLDNLRKMDASDDLRGRALRDTGSALIDEWKMTCVSTSVAAYSVTSPPPYLDPRNLTIKNDRVERKPR